MQKIAPRLYVKIVFALVFGTLAAVIVLGTTALFGDLIFEYQFLYRYQVGKIHSDTPVDIVFVGDSSLGNAIDAREFSRLSGRPTLNLALTGRYGFAGSYNMVKKLVARQAFSTVVVMNSLDTLRRDTSYDGYLYTLGTLDDVLELDGYERRILIDTFFQRVLSDSTIEAIWKSWLGQRAPVRDRGLEKHDYIQQKQPFDAASVAVPPLEPINPDKTRFLRKLAELGGRERFRVLFVLGPIWDRMVVDADAYIAQLDGMINASGATLVPGLTLMADAELGDNIDHVAPRLKQALTQRYYERISPYLPNPVKVGRATSASAQYAR